jgi:UDP-hydrolysing UDP-N-acetyl-D-glucosamine 2-epimerase
MRVTAVITARPSYGRVQTALEALRADGVDLTVLCVGAATSPKYGRVFDQIHADGFYPLELTGAWDDNQPCGMVHMVAHQTARMSDWLHFYKPDAVITVADRYETLATAIAASYQNIPLVHIQGGEVSGNIDDKVRNATTQLADLHLVATHKAGQRVKAMGPKVQVHVTGCPSIDLALRVTDDSAAEMVKAPKRAAIVLPGIGPDVDTTQPFLLVLHHPVTDSWQDAGEQTAELLAAVEGANMPCLWFWPNVDAGAAGVEKELRVAHERGARIRFIRQVPPADFIRLMRRCSLMLGNSSAAIREGSALGTPALLIGNRQRGREMAHNVIPIKGVLGPNMMRAVMTRSRPGPSTLYGDGQAGPRIARILQQWWANRRAA